MWLVAWPGTSPGEFAVRQVQRGPPLSVNYPATFRVAPLWLRDRHAQLGCDSRQRLAVVGGERVETSGQGGWDDKFGFPESLQDETAQAFENVERTLATAGASWADVVHMNSYHVLGNGSFDDHNRVMVEQLRTRMGDRAPIWTASGVTALGLPQMRIEIRVTAITG